MRLNNLDIMACYGTDAVSRLISTQTLSLFSPGRLFLGPSHVALICHHNGSPVWFESTTLCNHPCIFQNLHVSGVQAHLPEDRIHDYVDAGGRVDVYRLSDIDSLDRDESSLLHTLLTRHLIGRKYDVLGAAISGTRAFKFSRFAPGADLESLFCSELIAKLLQVLGRMNRANPTQFNPGSLLRTLVREGTYRFVRGYRKGCGNTYMEVLA